MRHRPVTSFSQIRLGLTFMSKQTLPNHVLPADKDAGGGSGGSSPVPWLERGSLQLRV